MKSLIIGDIHHKTEKADRILETESFDSVYFLGDWADDFGDNADVARKTAKWVKDKLNKPNHFFIFGNHDLAYYPSPCEELSKCSGFTTGKAIAINQVLTPDDWDKIKFYYWVQDWLLTHAGLHQYHFTSNKKPLETVKEFLVREDKAAREEIDVPWGHGTHWFFQAGRARYGNAKVGGLTWCDAEMEFKPIQGVKQIFGHTPQRVPLLINESNICIDTFLNYYIVLTNGKVDVKSVA